MERGRSRELTSMDRMVRIFTPTLALPHQGGGIFLGDLLVEEVEGGTQAEPFELGLAECVVELQCLGCAV